MKGSELEIFSTVTDSIIMLHFVDGHVDHYGLGESKSDDIIFNSPLDIVKASSTLNYAIISQDDENYLEALHPQEIGRKSKGIDFSGNASEGFPIVQEHFIYLILPHSIKQNKKYTIILQDLASNTDTIKFSYNYKNLISETFHVNQLGYVTDAPVKYAYLSDWMGDIGPLELENFENKEFQIIDVKDNSVVFSEQIRKRKDLETGGVDGNSEKDTPYGSFVGADVWVCDFSEFQQEGEYRIAIGGIGCSYTFKIGNDILREGFYTVTRALYHQRCGTALESLFTDWTRGRCHHPAETDTVILSDWRYMDKRNAFTDLPEYSTGIKRPFWGGWHDAADWDKRTEHLEGTRYLLFAFDLKPDNFNDNELNIPESGNSIPDILDEASWNIDFFKRIQDPDGGIHGGVETTGHPKSGIGSVEDQDQWYAYAPDPVVSFSYAGTAGYLSICLDKSGFDVLAEEYLNSAILAYEWGLNNTPSEDEGNIEVRDQRHFASSVLYRKTGEEKYQQQFLSDNLILTADTKLYQWQKINQSWGSYIFALTDHAGQSFQYKEIINEAILNWAEFNLISPAEKRGYRFGSDFYAPTGWGTATTPNFVEIAMAWFISGDPAYLSYGYTNCDYILGANPLNMCWVSGLGYKYPKQIMHLDSRYYHENKGQVPGLIPMGPAVYDVNAPTGHWEEGHAYQSAYPAAELWPSHEMYFENQYCAKTNEFTVHKPLLPAAAAFGFFSSPYYKDLSHFIISGERHPKYYQENLIYQVEKIPDAQYNWIFPEGIEIIEGSDSSRVLVNWGCTGGIIILEIDFEGKTYSLKQKAEIEKFRIKGPDLVAPNTKGVSYSVDVPDTFQINWYSQGGLNISSETDVTNIEVDVLSNGILYLEITSECGSVLDSLTISIPDPQAPYPDRETPHVIPGIIKSAWYDDGGEGISYHDNDPENNGPGIRQTEGVDTEEKEESQTVGWIETGEWLEYSVEISQTDYYQINTRVASPNDGGKFLYTLDNSVITDTLYSVNTGSWSEYMDVTGDSIFLSAGQGVIRLDIIEGGFNVGDISFRIEEGIPELIFDKQDIPIYTLFPIPAEQVLKISIREDIKGRISYKILNLTGQICLTGVIDNYEESLNIENLNPGCYIFTISHRDGFAEQLFVKK